MSNVHEPTKNDVLLIALGVAAVVGSLWLAVAEAIHLVPTGIAVLLLIVAGSVAIRVLFRLRARRSSALSNPRVMKIVTTVLVAVSAFSAVIDLIVTFQSQSFVAVGDFWPDLGLHLWSLAVVLIIAIPARTMGWRSVLGLLLVGLLSISSLALLVGSPVVDALGAYDDRAVALWVPFTEEFLKALPVALFALLAARNTRSRPSAVDFGLLGFAVGTSFALIENADFGRFDGSITGALPFSALFPSVFTQGVGDQAQLIAGHAVWTGLIGLAVGFGVLYRRRFRFAWVVIPVAFLISFAEHGLANADQPPVFAVELTADGMLSPALLLAGLVVLAWFERRPLRSIRDLRHGLLLDPRALAAHRAALADRQRPRRAATSVPQSTTASTTPSATAPTGENR